MFNSLGHSLSYEDIGTLDSTIADNLASRKQKVIFYHLTSIGQHFLILQLTTLILTKKREAARALHMYLVP